MPKKSDIKPFARYGRTSRLNGRDASDNISREDQFEAVDRSAATFDLPTLPEEFYDTSSGATFERPEWERAIALIRDGKAGGIIAFNLKRIGRAKTAEMLAMVEEVESLGGRLYDQTGRVSVDDADAELITTVKAMMGRREWRERRAYLLASVENAIDRGVHLDAPYGYARPERAKGEKASPLVINEQEAPAVRRMFELRADGHSWPAIATELNGTGYRPRPWRRHGRTMQAQWTGKVVRQIVGNEVYLGTAYNGQHRHPGAHPAIIKDLDLFARANKAKGVKPQGPKDGYSLTGLPRCSGCGYVMLHSVERGRRYYRCKSGQHGNGRCPAPASVPAEQLEEYVLGEYECRFIGIEMEASDAEDALGQALAHQANVKAAMKRTTKLLNRAESDSEREVYEEELADLGVELREADDGVVAAHQQRHGVDIDPNLDADGLRDMPAPEQRRLFSEAFACVVVWPAAAWREPAADRARILSRNEAPSDSTGLIARVAGLRR
jgi:DNA invertase Pin-like site-specific DNA recombinase